MEPEGKIKHCHNPEEKVGISEYISDHEGFFAIIKQRFSDFHVNEILSSGEVVNLTSKEIISPPEVSTPKNLEKPEEIKDEEIELLKVISGQKHFNEVKPSTFLTKSDLLDEAKVQKKFVKGVKSLEINVEGISKERRTAVHQFVKSHFPNLISQTKEVNNEKFIMVKRAENASQREKRSTWPKSLSHVNFVLYKENVDTIEAINLISGKLRLRPNMFSYAGTKDRRAKTSQIVSVSQVRPQNLSSAAKALRGIHIGNFSFNNKPLKLGQLKGNHFRLVLREVKGSDEMIERAVKSLKENGFINYYGMQRFSSTDVPTHKIGIALLQGNWKEAVNLILFPRENDFPDLMEAKKIWKENQDAAAAFKVLIHSRKYSIEGQLLSGLASHDSTDLVGALDKISRNTKLLYIHAYQSYIWNSIVSKRISKYKLQVLPGDIIRKEKKISESDINVDCPMEDDVGSCDDTLDGSHCSSEDHNSDEAMKSESKNVHILSKGETSNVDISKVLMPLPGYNIVYPDNEIKDWYLELLKKDDLSFDTMKHRVKSYSLGGAYRTMVVCPQSLEYTTCFYEDSTKPLIQSDLDVLNNISVSENQLSEGPHKAVILEFSLPSSTYATMALRELLKMETSSQFQSTLNGKTADTEEQHSLKRRLSSPCSDEKKIKLN